MSTEGKWGTKDLAVRAWPVEIPGKYALAADPLSGTRVRRYSFEIALKHPDGAVAGDVPEPPRIAAPATPGACGQELRALEERLQVARPERDRVLPPIESFARQPPNLALARAAQAAIHRSAAGVPEPSVECHGRVCRISDFDFAAHLGRDPDFRRAFSGPWRDASGAYFRSIDVARESNDADEFLRALLWKKRAESYPGLGIEDFMPFVLCRQHFSADGAVGTLKIHLVVPATGELNADGEPERVSAHLDGSALGTPFGKCVSTAIHARIDGVVVARPMVRRAEREMKLGLTVPAKPR